MFTRHGCRTPAKSNKFFYKLILSGDGKMIKQAIQKMLSDSKEIIRSALELSYFSRGAWKYETVMMMSAVERDLAFDLLKERQEALSKNPFAQI